MDQINYNVNAFLRARGNFAKQMQRQSNAVKGVQDRWGKYGAATESVGRTVMGTTAATAAGYAKMAAGVAALGAGAGFAKLLQTGTQFNEMMESSRNSIGAMYQLYGQNAGNLERNLAQATHAQRALFDMTKKSPAEFEDAVNIYQGAASGLIVANQSMQEQMKFMKGAQMLPAVIPDLPSNVLGGQLGRIMMGGAGAEFEVWKRLAPSILKAGQATGVFAKNMRLGEKFTQRFNMLAQEQPEVAMELLKTSVLPLEKMAAEFERSWVGIWGATKTNMKMLAGAFTKPFHEMRKKLLYDLNKTGLFSDANIGRLEHIATALGMLFSGVMERAFNKLISWVEFLRDNWESITTTFYSVGQQVAMLIKGAFFVGVARMVAGATMVAAGRGLQAGQGVARALPGMREAIARRSRATHMGLGRGMGGKGRGLLGMMGGGLAKVFGRLETGSFRLFRGMDKLVLKFATMAAMGIALGAALALVALAIGAVLVITAGIATYVISNWDAISKSIIDGLESGKISLVPFVVALYTFKARLEAVGQAFLGGTTGADMFTGAMNWGIKAFNLMSDAIAITMKAIAISIGVWGALKLAFQGLLWVILKVIELIAEIPGAIDADTVERARRNYESFDRGVQDTFTTVDQLLMAADKIAAIDVKSLDMKEINRQAEEWKRKLIETLKGDGDKKKPKGPTVNVQNVTINQDLRDTDPDRLMASFIKPMQSLADRRIQAYDQLDMGE